MEELEQLGYLARLMIRLTFGAAQLPSETQKLHGEYVVTRQRADGGWAGREGESDIYYTSFALRSLAILGLLDGKVAQRSADFLRSRMHSHEGIVDLLSLVYSVKLLEATCSLDAFEGAQEDWEKRLAELLDTLRRDDGGFSKSLEGRTGSTYQTFLVLLCLELIERPCPEANAAYSFLMSQQQDDGGFLEIRVGKRSGANPTAAAMGALRILGKLHDVVAEDAAEFLAELQTDEGGFQANTRIPLPDLLSTFTACVTLADVERLESISTKGVQQYVESMQQATGGFRGFEYDPGDDVEYSFYGLGTLALLQTL
ncbi:MAG: prenyltransferase/squalene oxidase repeat-containing protein [Planctomycetota bacterium]|nr:prenyltransferase/squalene oxidase repeat-containing protein [Planctomycetota bacterium]